MEASFYLRVKGVKRYYNGWTQGPVSVFKSKPSAGPNEVVVKVDMTIPDMLFDKPTLQAKIVIPDNERLTSTVDAEVQETISEMLSAQLGLKVELSVADQEQVQQ